MTTPQRPFIPRDRRIPESQLSAWRRDGFESQAHMDWSYWGKEVCEHNATHIGSGANLSTRARAALEYAKSRGLI